MPDKIVELINKIAEAKGEGFAEGALAVIDMITPSGKIEKEQKEAG